MAAGEGTRLRPLTETWPKPILPIDGRPVIATLLRSLAAAGIEEVVVVTGHLAELVEELVGDGTAFGLRLRCVRQPGVLGSADTVQRALADGLEPPFLVLGADTVFEEGAVVRFLAAGAGADGAVCEPAAPLWLVGPQLVQYLCVDREPYELANAFERGASAGLEIRTIDVGKTRDLTRPQDLIRENFPYLSPATTAADGS